MRNLARAAFPRLRLIWFAIKERLFLLRTRGRHDRFAAIYSGNLWKNGESRSGYGSTLDATRQARDGIAAVIADKDVQSLLDVPCGDFNWMQSVPFEGDYKGADIVPDLIEANTRRFASDRRRFIVADLVSDALPRADLVLCRECLNHLSLAEAATGLANLTASANIVLIATHYPNHPTNTDQPASFRYRPLNLTLPPFDLRQPDRLIEEDETEPGKTLGVWFVSDQPPLRGRIS